MMNPLAGPAGPGKFSTRTDKLEMGSTAYGEGVETQAIKSGAPLSKTPDTRPARAGDDMGAGPGSSALMMQKNVIKLSDSLAQMLPYDTTGEIAVLYQEALAQGN
jgi:hypothetical protein